MIQRFPSFQSMVRGVDGRSGAIARKPVAWVSNAESGCVMSLPLRMVVRIVRESLRKPNLANKWAVLVCFDRQRFCVWLIASGSPEMEKREGMGIPVPAKYIKSNSFNRWKLGELREGFLKFWLCSSCGFSLLEENFTRMCGQSQHWKNSSEPHPHWVQRSLRWRA